MKYTNNYYLKKPDGTDLVNINDLNENMDILDTEVAKKVNKVAGKDLSTEDYTTAEKTKLAGIATGANNYTHPSSHPFSILTGVPAQATRWPTWGEVTGKPGTFAPSSHSHAKGDVGLGSVPNYGMATQAQARAGASNAVFMSPLRVKEAIEALGSVRFSFGTYIGNDSDYGTGRVQNITVGFTPKLVFIFNDDDSTGYVNHGKRGPECTFYSNMVGTSYGSIISNGFAVKNYYDRDSWEYNFNNSGWKYAWVAFG